MRSATLKNIPLRRRSSDWGLYWGTMVVGVLGGIYIWVEPLREIANGTVGPNDKPAPATAPIPEHLQQQQSSQQSS